MTERPPVVRGKRIRCAACLRPQSTCLCQWVTPTSHHTEVLILQHPMEVTEAKGSARLLHLSLQRSQVLTGEVFGAALDAALHGPHCNLLLFPETRHDLGTDLLPPVPEPAPRRPLQPTRLVVLDGTWRKCRKMLVLNPQLQSMRRLPLAATPASRYLIRKAHEAHQLSTLEATCVALAQLEGDAFAMQSLLDAFDGFIGQQLARRPAPAGRSTDHGSTLP
ncbi:MAG: DTW domain-containing protein [Variovorax sp.]|nr:MAG: DTW domain-containing protein [Variovorax sp.]